MEDVMTSYRTPKTGIGEQIADKADGETYIPILPNTLDRWAQVTKGLESSLATVEDLLAEYKEKVAQLGEYAGLLDRYYVAGAAITLKETRRIGKLRPKIVEELGVASNDSPEK